MPYFHRSMSEIIAFSPAILKLASAFYIIPCSFTQLAFYPQSTIPMYSQSHMLLNKQLKFGRESMCLRLSRVAMK